MRAAKKQSGGRVAVPPAYYSRRRVTGLWRRLMFLVLTIILISVAHADEVAPELVPAAGKKSGDASSELSSFPTTDPASVFSSDGIPLLPPVDLHAGASNRDQYDTVEAQLPGTAEVSVAAPGSPMNSGDCGESVCELDGDGNVTDRLSFYTLMNEPYRAYRVHESDLSWMPGSGQDFGWVNWVTEPYLERSESSGITSAFNIHWLSGPDSAPLPPRLYDLSVGAQVRDSFSNNLSYDLYAGVGLFTDFEGSARDGVRFPAHAVGMLHASPNCDFVFGIEYLDRDQVSVLPVFGVSMHNTGIPNLRLDLVFPRPRIDYAFNDTHRVYLAGTTGGGKWDIDFPDGSDQVMSYRDYRLVLGFESADDDGELSAWEFGWVFSRSLEFREMPGDTRFDDAFLIRWVTRR